MAESDASKKYLAARDLDFISFNYFVQREKSLIKWNGLYEKAIRSVYLKTQPLAGETNHYFDPLGWKMKNEKPKRQFPKSHELTFEEYQEIVEKFRMFLNEKT